MSRNDWRVRLELRLKYILFVFCFVSHQTCLLCFVSVIFVDVCYFDRVIIECIFWYCLQALFVFHITLLPLWSCLNPRCLNGSNYSAGPCGHMGVPIMEIYAQHGCILSFSSISTQPLVTIESSLLFVATIMILNTNKIPFFHMQFLPLNKNSIWYT